ncbi:MAG: CRP/FNR family cyclic AMP-dependent transcriptional regulator [Planctomycetota bacterium]|jgi:CRP/FNR family cyclic AMP-dependent transcriptional regulator
MPYLTTAQKSTILADVPLFASLAKGDLDAIASVATTRAIKAREELFHKGDSGSQVYVVASGQLKVISTSMDGDDLMFCVLDPGEIIGEIGLLADTPRTATVVAITKSELVVIDQREFRSLLRTRPEVSIELLAVVARRLVRVSEFVEDTQFLNLPVRLAKKFVDFAGVHGEPASSGGVLINLKLSQEEWGDLVGTTRESINKQLRTWTSEELIAVEKGKVIIRDLDAVEKLANCLVL